MPKKLQCPSKLSGASKWMIGNIVGRLHVGEDMSTVREAVAKKIPKRTRDKCPGFVRMAQDYAEEVHSANRKLYAQVMRGSFGGLAARKKTYRTPRGCVKSTSVQSLIFAKSTFTKAQALAWARKHKFKATKADCKANTCRVRQVPPTKYCKGTFRTIPFRSGVKAVVGKKKLG